MSMKYVGLLIALLTMSPHTVATQAWPWDQGWGLQVSWTPAKLTPSPFIGTVSSVPITFVSRTPLFGVRVWIVPALAPYVSAVPSEFASVPANTPMAVTLVITVPKTATPSTILGAIHLVDSRHWWRILAPPLPVELDLQQPPTGIITIEPDWSASGSDVSHASPGVTLSGITPQYSSDDVSLVYSPVYVRNSSFLRGDWLSGFRCLG